MKKIHILQVLTLNRNSGIASFIMNIYQYIDREKVQFDFLTWVVDKNLPVYNNIIENMGGNIYTIPYYKNNFYGFIKNSYKILCENNITILHCHEFLASIPILYLGKKAGIPIRIAHSHNPTIDQVLKRKLAYICHPIFKHYATKFLACSKDSGHFLFGEKANYSILKNGIIVSKFQYSATTRNQLRQKLGLENKFIIGNIGRMVTQKNQSFLLYSFAKLIENHPNFHLILIGKGNLESNLRHQVELLGIKEHVLFLGVRDDICDLLNIMDVFVFPSIYEGLGIVLIEAQANGLPCIVSDCVPKEVQLNSNCHFVSLKSNYDIWNKLILDANRIDSEKAISNVNNAGYNIIQSAKILEELYLSENSKLHKRKQNISNNDKTIKDCKVKNENKT